MIREAKAGDTARVLELLADAHPHSAIAPYAPFSPTLARQQFLHHLSSPHSLCLVYEVDGVPQGIFVAKAGGHPMWPVRIAVEVVSWLDERHRGHGWFLMMEAFEQWAVSNGCPMTSLSSKEDARFGRVIQRSGYLPVETNYLKVL